jgi:hypothetical protein
LKVKDVDLYSGVPLAMPLVDWLTMWQPTGRNVEGVWRQAVMFSELALPDSPTGCQASWPSSI